ncbi:MAG: aldehyde dehydrogenase family protein [Paracoccaceae bacterium]
MDHRQHYIDGAWVDPEGGTACDVIDPSTEGVVATVTLASDADTDRAVAAAKSAFDGWARSSKAERLELMRAIQAGYAAREAEIAQAISREMGAPIDMARGMQVGTGTDHIQVFLDVLERFEFEHPLSDEHPDTRIIHAPVGVAALITPWNWPINQIALKVMPALAAGCATVLKPSELSPLSGMIFADIVHGAGAPAGVFNLINGDGPGAGSRLSAHPDIDMVSFTGSTRAGSAITKAAADTVKRVTLELGGKGANIVFADARPGAVADGVARCMLNSGQSCNAATRMLVERPRYDEAVAQAAQAANALSVDIASNPGKHIGPLVSRAQWEKVQGYVHAGMEEGARLVAGGPGLPDGLNGGFFARPTVFADVDPSMSIWREEIFGPVLSMMPFDTEEEAIALANDTRYGLTNYVQTEDGARANRVARAMRTGMVDVNGRGRGPGAPFGGMKESGNGREGGVWGLEDFLEVQAIGGWSVDAG